MVFLSNLVCSTTQQECSIYRRNLQLMISPMTSWKYLSFKLCNLSSYFVDLVGMLLHQIKTFTINMGLEPHRCRRSFRLVKTLSTLLKPLEMLMAHIIAITIWVNLKNSGEVSSNLDQGNMFEPLEKWFCTGFNS